MKSRKTSYSLSKLNVKKYYNEKSQRSFDKNHTKRNNLSQIQNLPLEIYNLSESRQAVYNEYYQTDAYKLKDNQQNSQQKRPHKFKKHNDLIGEIQQKMRKVMQSQEYQPEHNLNNIVLQQSDGDQDFQQKIVKNKALLKMQRQKNINTQSQQNINKQIYSSKNDKKSIKKLSLIQNKIEKPLRKLKSKSLFPPINSLSSKALNLNLVQDKEKKYKNKLSNEHERKLTRISNHQFQQYLKKEDIIMEKNQNQAEQRKNQICKRKMTELSKNKFDKHHQERKLTELKLESKIEVLKGKLAQRTSGKLSKSKIQNRFNEEQIKKIPRYSSNSIFDNIQEFLSNPHENNSKSKRKFMKLYEKIEQSSQIHTKQSQKIKQRIKKISQKIKDIQNSNSNQNSPQILNQNVQNQLIKNETQQNINPSKQFDNFPLQHIESEYGTLQWYRMQKSSLKKSDFDKQLKYVLSLEQKNNQILKKYVQNQQILHELKVFKKNQQIIDKNIEKTTINRNEQNYSSL